MREYAAISRAIVRKPAVFQFDEPLSNLDAALRMDLRTKIGKLHAQPGATMIHLTHDQVAAMTFLKVNIPPSRHHGGRQIPARAAPG